MKKNITVAAAEALAANGWEADTIERDAFDTRISYKHPNIGGCVTVWSSKWENTQIITYFDVPGMVDGYIDLSTGEFIEMSEVITW